MIDSFGIPLPVVDILLAGYAVKAPSMAYWAALMAVVGSTVGNVALFQAACHGSKLISKDGPSSTRGQRFQQWFQRYGLLSVFIPAVTPIVPFPLKVFVISAGCLRTKFSKFLAVVLVARTIRYFGDAWLGLLLGRDAEAFLHRNAWPLLGAAVAMGAGVFLLLRYTERRSAPSLQ